LFHKKNNIQLECVSKAYNKDLIYLKRNTKFLSDRWGLKTSTASKGLLNEIVFRSHERSVKSLRKVDWLCVFSPKVNELIVMTIWLYSSNNRKQIALKVQRCPCPSPHRPLQRHTQYQLEQQLHYHRPTELQQQCGVLFKTNDIMDCGFVAIFAYAVVFIQQESDLPGDMTFCGNIQLKLLPNMLQLCPYFATSHSKR
jgi:hypothetical protein